MDWTQVLQDWVSPAGLLILFGGIVWGIQLNMAVMLHTKALGMTKKQMDDHEGQLAQHSQQINKASYILDVIEKRLENLSETYDRHTKEAEDWKLRVVKLEERVNHGQHT